jgi:hypothetical protein
MMKQIGANKCYEDTLSFVFTYSHIQGYFDEHKA